MRSGILICRWKGKGWRTCTLAVLKYPQSLRPELGRGRGGAAGHFSSYLYARLTDGDPRGWVSAVVSSCSVQMHSQRSSQRTEKEKVPLEWACAELPKTVMEGRGCVRGHEAAAEAVVGRSVVPVQLAKLKGLESEGKWIVSLLLRRDKQWGATRLETCSYSSSPKKQGFVAVEGLIR